MLQLAAKSELREMRAIHVEVTPQLMANVAAVVQKNWCGVSHTRADSIAEDVIEYLAVRSASGAAADRDSTSTQWRSSESRHPRAGLPPLLVDILANQRDSA